MYSLHHVIDLDWMMEAYRLTRKDGAPGIDGVTAAEYEVNLDKPASPDLAERLLRGVVIDGKRASAARVRRISAKRLQIVLTQGLNRQIRRMLDRFGLHAKRLQRIRIANLSLHDLPPGKWRQLSQQEVRNLTVASGAKD